MTNSNPYAPYTEDEVKCPCFWGGSCPEEKH